jgi:hypothetical protein
LKYRNVEIFEQLPYTELNSAGINIISPTGATLKMDSGGLIATAPVGYIDSGGA